jgi:hypothetical protein
MRAVAAVASVMLTLLAFMPLTAAASGRAGSTYLFSGRTFSQSPYYYRYTSPYYCRGGFLSPYVRPVIPRYDYLHVTPRYHPSYRYDRTGRFDTRRYEPSDLDRLGTRRFDGGRYRFDSSRTDRFHRPVPNAPGARIYVPPARPRVSPPPPAGLGDRYHFRGSSGGGHAGRR